MGMKIIVFLLFVIFSIILIFYFQQINPNYVCKDCNVILISIDSLRADHVGVYGYEKNTTPNIDRFASESILFKNYITQSYLTPVSEFSLHTSLYPHQHGLIIPWPSDNQYKLTNPPVTIAEILKSYNYTTIAISTSPEFKVFRDFGNGYHISNFSYVRDLPVIDEQLISVMKNKKFFLWLAIGTVHAPYGKYVPEEIQNKYENLQYRGLFKNKVINLVEINSIYNYTYYPLYERGEWLERNVSENPVQLNQDDIDFIVAKYDAGIEHMDNFLGNFFNILKSAGLEKNTIIIFTSSHGEELGEHKYIMHYDIHESEIHVPLIIKHPGLEHKIIYTQTQSIDILPTILDFLKIPQYEKAEGNSLVPLIYNEDPQFNKYIFIERSPLWEEFAKTNTTFLPHIDFGVRTSEWKLIYRTSRDFEMNNSWWGYISGQKIFVPEFELYNIKQDPKEQKNLYFDRIDVADRLKTNLFEWIKEKGIAIFNRTDIEVVKIFPYP